RATRNPATPRPFPTSGKLSPACVGALSIDGPAGPPAGMTGSKPAACRPACTQSAIVMAPSPNVALGGAIRTLEFAPDFGRIQPGCAPPNLHLVRDGHSSVVVSVRARRDVSLVSLIASAVDRKGQRIGDAAGTGISDRHACRTRHRNVICCDRRRQL